MAISLRRPCRCGHAKDAHEHYRRGTDCSGCRCTRFQGRMVLTVSLGPVPVPVTQAVVPDEVPYPDTPYVRPTHTVGSAQPLAVPAVARPRTAGDHVEHAPRLPEQAPSA